jgi:hypothetical protein
VSAAPAPEPLRLETRALVLVALLACTVAAPSLLNGFAYDDRWIIVSNGRVHDLHRWADWVRTSYWPTREASLYRPLTTAAYAVQWVVGGGAPWIFHALSTALYVAGAVAFAWFASLLLPARAALVAGALFAVDPVHVEAVGNIVGQAELSAGFIMLCACIVYLRARRAGGPARSARLLLAALYLAAMLIKEHAIVLPVWFFVMELTVLREPRDPRVPLRARLRARMRTLAPLGVLMAAACAFTVVVRWDVLGALGGDIPHPAIDGLGIGQRAFVMLGVLPDFARLLLWPAKLYVDYSPAHVMISPTPDPSQLNGALIACGAIVLIVVAWRRSAVAACGLLLAAAVWLPTANLVFPSGVLLAERTLYLPSAGILLAAGSIFAWIDRRGELDAWLRPAAGAALALLLVGGIVRSVQRERVWRSSDDVFLTMVRDEPLSFKAHHAWGSVLFERGDRLGGEREWRMAIRIFPGYYKIYQDLAGAYLEAHLCNAAIPLYEKAIVLGGPLPLSRGGLVACQLQLAQFRAARHTARLGMIDGNDLAWFRARMFSAESALVARDSIRR